MTTFLEGVSVIICCYNSTSVIQPTLEHIQRQQGIENIPLQVILVDNASNDDTSEFASSIWKKFTGTIDFQIVREERSGLIHARKKGLASVKHDIVVFCDDDNWFSPMYIYHAHRVMTTHAHVGVVGGFGTPHFESSKPSWFEPNKSLYAVGKQGSLEGETKQNYLYGAGMTLRKSTLELIKKSGYEIALTGRKGGSMTSGEDTELTMVIKIIGLDLWYCPDMKFEHFIKKERTSSQHLRKLQKGIYLAEPYLIPHRIVLKDFRFPTQPNWVSIFQYFLRKYVTQRLLRFNKPNHQDRLVFFEAYLVGIWKQRKTFSRTMEILKKLNHSYSTKSQQLQK